MKKISFRVGSKFKEEDKSWVPEVARGIFLKKAEEDYVAFRILFTMNMLDTAYYHLHQCIEKYLKTFILDNDIEHGPFYKQGHELEYWAKLCASKDDFFEDEELVKGLTELSHLVTLMRYPSDTIQSWSSSPGDLLKFLDEFVFEMRTKIRHLQYEDIIEKFLNGYISSHPTLRWMFNDFITPEQIKKFITCNNDYFKERGTRVTHYTASHSKIQ